VIGGVIAATVLPSYVMVDNCVHFETLNFTIMVP